MSKSPQTPFFDVAIASADGQPIQCLNKVRIQPHGGIEAIDQTDLLVIASATYIEEILQKSPGLVPWIRRQYEQGAQVASICTGVFLLAETGLLDGKSATLHWGFTETFRRRYPRVPLEPDRMFLDHGRLYCSAGVNAGMDLSLHGVHRLRPAGREVPDEPPFAGTPLQRDHTTPLGYLQQLRVETAKRLLEEGTRTFDEITYQVGYEDIPFFRKVFVRLTGLRPRE